MPRQETTPMLERHHFAHDLDSGQWTMTELCTRYGISRNTGYKWAVRYRAHGVAGLHDQSRAPCSSPHQTAPDIVTLIVQEHTRLGWGAHKILKRLQSRDPRRAWPSRSTIFDILARHDRVRRRRRRQHWQHPGAVPLRTTAPNPIWTIDVKGQFRMRNGVYCYPLTVIVHYSRYLLCCDGLPDVTGAGVKPQLERLFRRWDLPDAIRSDNGSPFASTGIHGLCHLNTWWLQLGITHQRIVADQVGDRAVCSTDSRNTTIEIPISSGTFSESCLRCEDQRYEQRVLAGWPLMSQWHMEFSGISLRGSTP